MPPETAALYNYYFKGSRDYVHGTTMFESFCSILREYGIDVFKVCDLKFHKELHSNGRVLLVKESDGNKSFESEDLVASMSINANNDRASIYLIENGDSPVTERKEDLTSLYIKEVVKTGDFESEAQLTQIDSFETFVTALIEVNKSTHALTLNDTDAAYNYRWAFLQNLHADLNAQFSENINVRIKHLGHKKGKEGIVYTLSKIIYQMENQERYTTVSFAYSRK